MNAIVGVVTFGHSSAEDDVINFHSISQTYLLVKPE